MRILHISAAHESTGAGYAAYNLHINLCKKGVRSDILFINSSQEHTISFETNFFRRVKRFLFTKIDRLILFFYFKKRVKRSLSINVVLRSISYKITHKIIY